MSENISSVDTSSFVDDTPSASVNVEEEISDNLVLVVAASIICGIIGLWILIVNIKCGLWRTVRFSKEKIAPFTYVYWKYTGRYDKVGPMFDKMGKIMVNKLGKVKAEKFQYAGFYLDDPHTIQDVNQCRAYVGFQVHDKKKDIDDDEIMTKFIKENEFYQQEYIGSECNVCNWIMCSWPSFWTVSVMIAVTKVWGSLDSKSGSNKHLLVVNPKCMEEYDKNKEKEPKLEHIPCELYPTCSHWKFCVPACCELKINDDNKNDSVNKAKVE